MPETVGTPWGDIPAFIFGSNTGVMSPKELEARRQAQIARAYRAQRGFPTTLGAGIASLGEALGENIADRRLRAAEQAEMDRAKAGLADPRFSMPGTGPSAALDPRTAVTAALAGPSPNPTLAAGDTPSPQELPRVAGGLPAEYAAAIAGIESSGGRDPYTVLGAVTPKGDRAFGKYQVMGANIPEWTQAALGQRLTPQQFLASKEAQDTVFQHRFGDYVNKYGPEGAARAWYAGEKGMQNLGATDQHGRLTVQGYGQDFLRRAQGARGAVAPTASSEAGGGDVMSDGSVSADSGGEGNPPTPTTIKPMQVAQALQSVPAAGAPREQSPVTSPVASPLIPEGFGPRAKPVAPSMDDRLNPYEIRGHQLMDLARGNTEMERRAKALIDYGASVRKTDYERKVGQYNADLKLYDARELAIEEAARNKPKTDFELDKARKQYLQEQQEKVNFPFGKDKALAMSEESFKKVENVPAATQAIANVRQMLTQNPKMFTGAGADLKMDVARLAGLFGKEVDPRVDATQSFRAFVAPLIAQLRSSIIGAGAQSEKELATLQQAAGADFKLEPGAIRNIIDAVERLNVTAAVQHQKRLLANAGGDPNARQVVFGNYELPMHDILPSGVSEVLRSKVGAASTPEAKKAEMDYFDRKFHTPGLAERLLGR